VTQLPLDAYLRERRALVDKTLDELLPPTSTRPHSIHDAMRYAVLGGGKRIRPILALAAAEACGGTIGPILRAACALELIHTYSLVHDDLPAMDDDDLRRGRKTTHVVYGEALAILAGDALLTEAFSWLAVPIDGVPGERQLRAVAMVAEAADSKGLIGGQVADIESERIHEGDIEAATLLETLEFIHRNKTGRLLTASVELGGLLAGADEATIETLRTYGRSVGLAFQIIDDLLDQEGTAESLGKTAGKDLAQGKLTYPALVGCEEARKRADALLETALESADKIGSSVNFLGELARYICVRKS